MPDNGPITIDSPAPLDDGALFFREMAGSEQLSACFTYKVLVSSSVELRPKDLLGMPIGVHLETTDGGTRHFHGVIASLQYVGVDENINYRLVLRPWFWLLTQSANCRIFQNRSVIDIVKSVFDDLGFADYDDTALTGEYLPKDYVVQYRETDFAFVSRLLERAGIYYFFRHEVDKHTLVLVDSTTDHDFPPSADGSNELSVPMVTPDDARGALSEHVDSWVTTTSVETGVYSHADYDFTNSRGVLRATQSNPAGNAHDSLEVYDYPGGFSGQDAGDAAALVRLQEHQVALETSEGLSNARRLTVGCLFSLTDCPRSDQNGDYLVTSMVYEMHGHEAETRNEDEEPTFRCEFEAISSDTQFRAPWATDKPVVRGPQTAVVVGPASDEIWTDAYGRVKVQFPWDREGQNDENSSCWVRVSQAWAGSSFGAIHIPRIGQEVIVDFLEGDPDRPIVTGRVYNDANMPPYDLPDNQTQSGIKSRSTPDGAFGAGNEIRFEDATGREEVFVQAEKDMRVTVKNDQSISVAQQRAATVGADDQLTVGGSLTRSVAIAETVTVGALQAVTVGAAQTLSVGAEQMTTVGATQTTNVGGDRAATVGGDDAVDVTGDRTINVGGDLSETVTGDVTTDTDGKTQRSFALDYTERHLGHRTVIVGAGGAHRTNALHVEGTGRVYFSKALEVEVLTSITIVCGDSQILISPQGITLTSPNISLVGSAVESKGDTFAVTTKKDLTLVGKTFTVTAKEDLTLGGKTVTAATAGAQLALDSSSANLTGSQVKLGSGSGSTASTSDSNADPVKITRVQMKDASGKPKANVRVLLEKDGEQRITVLDADGMLELIGDASYKVSFPDETVK